MSMGGISGVEAAEAGKHAIGIVEQSYASMMRSMLRADPSSYLFAEEMLDQMRELIIRDIRKQIVEPAESGWY